jgi:hypothetical protein
MSVTELQREIKNSVVTPLMYEGIGGLRLIQVDNFKWLIVTEVEGEERFAEISLTAKKADFTYDDAVAANVKYEEKVQAALQREADRAAKRAEKANAKGESRNSSGNLTSDPRSYDERYAAGDF